MKDLQSELEEVLKMKAVGSGFHYVWKAQRLGQTAEESRQWYNLLLKAPIWRWQKILSDTRHVLDELNALDISW